jgi:hypothetical protein
MALPFWKLANVLMFVLVLAANGVAGSGALSGESIGLIANRYPSYFLPASFIFGIWSLIYLGLALFTVFQALPTAAAGRWIRRLGPWWLISGALNIGWVTAFAFSRFGLAMLVMVALLATLIVIGERVATAEQAPRWVEQLCVVAPFGLYLAWISVALIANSFQYAHVVGWQGYGLGEATWSVLMMGVATALGWFMTFHRGAGLFPPVVAWAIYGIGVRNAQVPVLSGVAAALVPAGLAGGAIALWARRRRRAAATPE